MKKKVYQYIFLYFITATLVSVFEYVEFAKRTGGINVQPFINARGMKMVTTRELTEFGSIIIRTKANATFL